MRAILALVLLSASGPIVAAAPASPEASKPGDDKEKLICRRETPVGSLIASRKVCRTKSQWAAAEQTGNDEARKMVWDNQGRPTGN